MENICETHRLPNGMRLIHRPDASAVACLGIVVRAGTRDEPAADLGLAHLVEHMLFKGTSRRRAWHILNRLDSVGGEINAYTTREETFVYATVLKDDFERALDLLADIVFHSVFPEKELAKEVEVVLDEINSYEDSPSELIFDEFENRLFAGAPIGRNILGGKKQLLRHTPADLRRFVDENYRTDEMVFFSLGDISFRKIVRWAEKYFAAAAPAGQKMRTPTPQLYTPTRQVRRRRTCQCHCVLGNRAYDLFAGRQRMALYLLNNILGGPGMNSLLNVSLRERNGLAYTVESNVSAYSDTGVWSVYFGCDKKNRERCEALVLNELQKLRETPLTPRQLAQAKRQILGQLAISEENKENLILGMGKSYLYYNRYDSRDEIARQIAGLTSGDLQRAAQTVFAPDALSTLIYE